MKEPIGGASAASMAAIFSASMRLPLRRERFVHNKKADAKKFRRINTLLCFIQQTRAIQARSNVNLNAVTYANATRARYSMDDCFECQPKTCMSVRKVCSSTAVLDRFGSQMARRMLELRMAAVRTVVLNSITLPISIRSKRFVDASSYGTLPLSSRDVQ